MSVEWFDLGLRLRAAATTTPQPRLLHSPVVPAPHVVAARAHTRDGTVHVTAATHGTIPATATGQDALRLLGDLGASLLTDNPPALITDQPGTLPALHHLSTQTPPGDPLAPVAAHLAWWHDRADYPAGRAVVDTVTACATRWVTGLAPTAENATTWRTWLNVTHPGLPGLLTMHRRLTDAPPLPLLDVLAEDDLWAHAAARRDLDAGHDWRHPDTTARAALGLRSRCDAADLFAAALLRDPLHRARAVHSGHVVTGTATRLTDQLRRVRVTSDRLDVRLRPGNDVTGWTGDPTHTGDAFSGTVATAEVTAGTLVLTLTGTTGAVPDTGHRVTLHPAPPSVHRQRSGRRVYRNLYRARRSWLTTGRAPVPTRREVPLDVLVAGAEPD